MTKTITGKNARRRTRRALPVYPCTSIAQALAIIRTTSPAPNWVQIIFLPDSTIELSFHKKAPKCSSSQF